MKATNGGIMAMAILLAVTGIGFGIAQAGGTHSEPPGVSFEDQVIPQVAKSPTDDMRLTSAGEEFVPEDNWSGTDWQTRGPVETGAIEDTQMQNPIETGSLPNEELHGTEFPFPAGFVAHSNEDLDPFSRSGP
jgi:hypothetical protein